MATTRYVPPVREDSNPDKIRVKPSDLVGTLLVLQVLEVVEGFKTKHAPNGKPGVRLNVASVQSGKIAPDQMWLNDALVDQLRPYVGATIAVKIGTRRSNATGYPYLCIEPASDEEQAQADKYVDSNPNLFQQQSVAPAPVLEEPASSVGNW